MLKTLSLFLRSQFLAFCLVVIPSLGIAQTAMIDSLKRNMATLDKDTNLVKTYLGLSRNYLKFDYDSSLYFARKAVHTAESIGDSARAGHGYIRMGNVLTKQGDYDSAGWAYQNAYSRFSISEDSVNIARSLTNLGLVYRFMEKYPKALEYFFQSLEIKKRLGSKKDIGVAYQNIGVAFAILGEYTQAEEYLNNSLQLYEEAGDSQMYYSGLSDISSMYREVGRYDDALDALTRSYNYRLRIGDQTGIGICTYNLGLTSFLNKEYDQSIAYYNEAKSIFEELGNVRRVVGCHIRLAKLHFELEQYTLAEKEGVAGLEQAHGVYQLEKLHHVLAKVYYVTDKFQLAFDHLAKFSNIRDSILKEKNHLQLIEMQNKFDDEANKRKIAELQIKNDRFEQKARNKDLQNYVLWGAIVVILLIALMFYRQFRVKQETNETLREKNQIIEHSLEEKDVLLREIHHRVQNNLQFVSSLLNLQSRRVDDENTLDILKGCKQRIQSMALIHQKLYQETNLNAINILSYTQNLVDSLQSSYGVNSNQIQTKLDIDPIHLDINSSISIGLILSELVTNCYKYAFDEGSTGLLTIALHEKNDRLLMSVEDNGKGLPDGFSVKEVDSFGLKLVHSLAKKLKATVSVDGKSGTRVHLEISSYTRVHHGGKD
ncbi:MAG: tetratricopeptide repeat protein [Bacteroidia bacterium]|nr:tetratricopeptide repeat protein [Bacteroidia bacterium]